MARRIDSDRARTILAACGVLNPRLDFHALYTEQVDALIREADAYGYRAPKNANGSRARYWHAYLERAAARQDY
jgi:hypothetical protein